MQNLTVEGKYFYAEESRRAWHLGGTLMGFLDLEIKYSAFVKTLEDNIDGMKSGRGIVRRPRIRQKLSITNLVRSSMLYDHNIIIF